MRTDEPRAIALKDYRPPNYRLAEVHLDFQLAPEATRVTATQQLARTGEGAPLVLNGEHLKLISVAIDGRVLTADSYRLDDETLTLTDLPERFALTIVTELSPATNTALEGLYLSKGMFCTQCEAEGFTRLSCKEISSKGD